MPFIQHDSIETRERSQCSTADNRQRSADSNDEFAIDGICKAEMIRNVTILRHNLEMVLKEPACVIMLKQIGT
jgi:hypothetical protein